MTFGSARKRKGDVKHAIVGRSQDWGNDEDDSPAGEDRWKWLRFLVFFVLLFGTTVCVSRYTSLHGDYVNNSSFSPEMKVNTVSSLRVGKAWKDQCTIWMAPSSLKGVNGYGIYTTRDLADGESILGHPDGVSVPVLNYRYTKEPQSAERIAWLQVWKNYMWARGIPDHVTYEAPNDVIDYQTGFGSLPNHHCFFDVLHRRYPNPPYDDSLVNRFQDPGTGAFSYNMGREFIVTPAVEAGSEIFLNYGYCQREGGKHRMPSTWGEFIFTNDDFEEATSIIDDYRNNRKGVLEFDSSGRAVLPAGIHDRVANLIPKTKDEFTRLVEQAKDRPELLRAVAKSSLNLRTTPWIRENGICLETVVPKQSTLQQAGQGAFAKFHVSKGEIIVPAPLMQILDKKSLDLFDRDGQPMGTNLIMNYCFGHPHSTLLLCPNTNAALINHCSDRTNECGKGPNAEVRWSSGWDPSSDEWRNFTLEELLEQRGRGLAFEIVALRDIHPGEEVFIDYGIEWEEAWAAHVAQWRPPSPDDSFITAKEANENTGPILDAFVSGDLRKTVDHPHLFTGCSYYATAADERPRYKSPRKDWMELSDDELMEEYCGHSERYFSSRNYSRHFDKSHWPCSILEEQQDGAYIVRIHQAPWERQQPWEKNGVPRLLKDYRREFIHYFVKTGETDQLLSGLFRHPLGIRDEIFPQHWKNLP